MPRTLSTSHAGRASRSVDRMKKWPKKAEMRSPLEQRMRITASHAVSRVRLWLRRLRRGGRGGHKQVVAV